MRQLLFCSGHWTEAGRCVNTPCIRVDRSFSSFSLYCVFSSCERLHSTHQYCCTEKRCARAARDAAAWARCVAIAGDADPLVEYQLQSEHAQFLVSQLQAANSQYYAQFNENLWVQHFWRVCSIVIAFIHEYFYSWKSRSSFCTRLSLCAKGISWFNFFYYTIFFFIGGSWRLINVTKIKEGYITIDNWRRYGAKIDLD